MKRTPLKRSRVPVKRRRPGKPRRGRVVNRGFMQLVRERGCIIAGKRQHGCIGRVTFHHVRVCGSPKDDTRGIGLCCAGHLVGWSPFSIEAMGKERFEVMWEVSIEDEIAANVAAWNTRE